MLAGYKDKRKKVMPAGLYFGRLMLRTQAPGTQVNVLCLAIDINGRRVDIRCPAAVGVALGVADILTELRRFTAKIALQFSLSP
jgi:hypothetical protein